jgi:hypothetical protein
MTKKVHTVEINMNLKSYLDLYSLLQHDICTREERRAFGLSKESLKNRPISQILAWKDQYISQLKKPLLSDNISSYLYSVTFTLVVIAFILGLLSGITLLSYSGQEPVNVVYFIAIVIFLPLFTMMLSLISMFRANSAQSLLVHLSPSYWMEKILKLFPNKVHKDIRDIKINPLLLNWIVIRRSQCIALFFSIGILLALLAVVITQDVAFAWSTTLQITPEMFYGFLNSLALPWRDFVPSAVPSLELIEKSQYFRLGDKLSEEMVQNASKLGEWWKFLVFATLFYALFLRLVMYVIATYGYKSALNKSLFSLEGVKKLLRDMNEAIITTAAKEDEYVVSSTYGDIQQVSTLQDSYDSVQGWALTTAQIDVLNDTMKVKSPNVFEIGGSHTLQEDADVANSSSKEVLLYVKAWEPPTLEIVDYIELLLKHIDKITVFPIGTEDEKYQVKKKFIDIWIGKLSMIDSNKIWIKTP